MLPVSVMPVLLQLHQNYALYKFLLLGNGCRISCHHIINKIQNVAINLNMCTLAEMFTLFQLNTDRQEGITITSSN